MKYTPIESTEADELRKRIEALEAERQCPPHRWITEGGFWTDYYERCQKCGNTRDRIRY